MENKEIVEHFRVLLYSEIERLKQERDLLGQCKEMIQIKFEHLQELMMQHDKLTALAIEKSSVSYDERFANANKFRAQQNDLIQTFAKGDETRNSFKALNDKLEQNIRSVTERSDKGQHAIMDKINFLEAHLDQKITAYILVQTNRFEATDKQMQTLIDTNAEVSNRGLTELNRWKENTSGSIRVILAVGGFITALILALLVAYIRTF